MTKELREIVTRVEQLGPGAGAILATVIDLRGSGYRLPGARMMIGAEGETIGTVSGGCLEADVLERAKRVLATGKSEIFTYDTTGDENSVFSINMGCRGVIRILLEPIQKNTRLIETFKTVYLKRERQSIATLVESSDENEVKIGGRMFCGNSEQFSSDGLPNFLSTLPKLRDELSAFFRSEKLDEVAEFTVPEGSFEFAFENVFPPVSLLLFGAGADAVPVARIASEVGWQVRIHDHRPAFLTAARFPNAERLDLDKIDEPLGTLAVDDRTAAVVMTHNYGRDRYILPALLRSDAFYVGVLGPKRRTEQLLEEIARDGEMFSADQLTRLYAPVGLDIGGDAPESIALSIAAEIQSVLKIRSGGPLRDRNAPIYDRR